MKRRTLLKLAALGFPAARLFTPREAMAATGIERVIFLYFPDGVASWSENGDDSKWHATGSEHDFHLPEQLSPLEDWRHACRFCRGLSMGGTDEGSHPGGAQKLLTAADYGYGQSIDQALAHSFGADSAWRHLLLGVMSGADGASGDKFVSYPMSGVTQAPEDDPRQAFEALFGSWSSSGTSEADPARSAVLGAVEEDLVELRSQLGGIEKDKLDYHLSSVQELQARLGGTGSSSASCTEPALAYDDGELYDPARFDQVLLGQIDLTVLAMECGLTRVATIQCSHHTSELVMSRIPGTAFYDPDYDMRSHQASHYGSSHDPSSREYSAFLEHGRYWTERFATLLAALDARPEGGGTMLDHTACVLVTEVCDGNLHDHGEMPFIVAGGSGGGRLIDTGYRRHGDLWVSLAQACGQDWWSFGDASSGPIDGLF